jgi:hypothetical protein
MIDAGKQFLLDAAVCSNMPCPLEDAEPEEVQECQ